MYTRRCKECKHFEPIGHDNQVQVGKCNCTPDLPKWLEDYLEEVLDLSQYDIWLMRCKVTKFDKCDCFERD